MSRFFALSTCRFLSPAAMALYLYPSFRPRESTGAGVVLKYRFHIAVIKRILQRSGSMVLEAYHVGKEP